MLVATIAATATFKWLSSQNSSSSSRMQQNEAYQSAVAGIQETRSWMMYHGNDVGAIVRQYILGEKKPILLNDRLSHAISDKQNFDVWLTGVSEDVNGVRKLKIISKGKARNGSVHSESAILNVSGLYQVARPVQEEKRKKINFSYAYFGSSVRSHGVSHSTSMLINGNWTGNPLDVDEDLIVTGWARPSGSDFTITGSACFGGNLYLQNHFLAKNLYLEDEVIWQGGSQGAPFNVTGNAYFNGTVGQGKNGFNIGNMTVNGLVKTNQEISDAHFTVNGDMCVKESGQVYIAGSQETNYWNSDYKYGAPFTVNGNVWIDKNNTEPIKTHFREGDFSNRYDRIVLGNEATSTLYSPDLHPHSDYVKMRETKTFKEKKEWNKVCINAKTVGTGPKATGGCYENEWTKWNNGEYSPYVEISNQWNDKFYFYHKETGVTDVDFINKVNPYWKIAPAPAPHENPDWEPATLASYYVGGETFKDNTTSKHARYNYDDNSSNSWRHSPYCKESDGTSTNDTKDAAFRPKCYVTPWFKSKGKADSKNYAKPPITCADTVKKYCDEIWEKKEGCDGAKYKIDDILVTAISKFEPFAEKGCAKNITSWTNSLGDDLNRCYNENISDNTKKEQNLYNGYLVVKVRTGNKTEPKTKLNGKFIIIIDNDPSEMFSLPPTYDDQSFVFLYMREGASRGIEITPADQFGNYNYFIYTPKNVGVSFTTYDPWQKTYEINPQGGFLFGNTNFNGTIYAEAKNCAKISAITANELNFNEALLNSLTDSGILCSSEIPESECGGVGKKSASVTPGASGSSSSGSSTVEVDEMEYFISVAPQLDVTLESQYKSIESDPAEDTTVAQSIIVLPRIIYLTKDAKGTLSDYYSVVNLNGANENKSPSKVTCQNSIPTTGRLFQGGENYLPIGSTQCTYASNNYGNIPFFVVVSDAIGKVPEINFVEPNEKELRFDDEVTLSVSIPKYEGPEIEFNIGLTSTLPSGWTIETPAGVEARDGSGGYKAYYSVKASALATANRVLDVLKIKANDDAEDGRVTFVLTTPLKNCNIGANPIQYVFLKGHSTINLGSLEDFCNINSEYCATKGYDKKKDYLNCDLSSISQGWIKAVGNACSEINMNESWKCKSKGSIHLEAAGATIPNICELIIPEEYNIIEQPVGGESYNLFASVKRKKVDLTVDFDLAKDNSTQIHIYDELADEHFYCTWAQRECTFKVYAGAAIHLYHSEGSTDEGNFSLWSCTGDNCPNDGASSATDEFILPGLYSNHTVTANYRKEDHCFYEDFKNIKVFCDGSASDNDEGTCIDTCARSLSKKEMCEVKNTRQAQSKWLVMYNNNGEYLKPITDNTKGSIKANTSKNANNNSGRNSQILSTVTAGQYGTLTAMIQTHTIASEKDNDYLNSGFILRSSGKEYLIVNIFGAGSNKKAGNTILKARVCKGSGQSINNYNSGQCEIVPTINDTESLTFKETDFVKVALTLDDNDYLTVKAVIDDKTWTGGLDIKPFGLNDAENTYIGFGLADESFQLYDFGWTSTSFIEGCMDIPSISCSFADNYIGGTIPLNERVSPKVIISSWFSEKNCIAEYYYNGCDNQTSDTQNCSNNPYGNPGKLGAPLYNTMGEYQFTQSGAHGYMVDKKKTMDAQIKVTCPGDETSLHLAKEFYSCGTFMVGDVENCTEEEEIYNSSVSRLDAGEAHEFTIESGALNLRGSNLHIHVDEAGPADGPLGKKKADNQPIQLTVKLKSSNGMLSLPYTITQKGVSDIIVNDISNTSGFNPQEVTTIIITSSEYLNVEKMHIHNECPYKLKVDCEKATAELDFINRKWKVNVPVKGVGLTCSITPSSSYIESLENQTDCGKTFELDFDLNNLQKIGFSPSDLQPTFKYTVKDAQGKTGSCPEIRGNKIPENEISCSIPEESKRIKVGGSAPTFSFTLSSSLQKSADYTLTLDGKIVKTGIAKANEKQNITPTLKEIEDLLGEPLSVGNHVYEVKSMPKTCSQSFVVENDDKQAPKIESCSIDDDDGMFTATISNPDNVEYSYSVGRILTPQGNVDGTEGSSRETTLSYQTKENQPGTYTYIWKLTYGKEKIEPCTAKRTITVDPSTKPKITCSNVKFGEYGSIVLEPTITNCDDGCGIHSVIVGHYENGQIVPNCAPSNELLSTYTFYHNNASGTINYAIQALDKNDKVIASCNFDIDFDASSASTAKSSSSEAKSSASAKKIEITKYDGNWQLFTPGTYNVTCSGNPYGGKLVCKCVNNNWGAPNCDVEYEGFNIEIRASEDSGGREISRPEKPCRDGQGGTLKVFSDVHCKYAW